MIGPVSGTGRAMMASLQQAMQKGMPPDQAIQYVKSMATQGVAPLADLYAMMNQFQRLKQQPAQAPQTPPTIRDQLNMAEQQQAMMQQGVASLPAPVMEQAQFAGGGIVAFANRGLVEDDVEQEVDLSNVSPEQLESLAAGENLTVAKAATKEILRRTGYKPLGQRWKEGFEQGVEKYAPEFPLIRYDPRPFPSHMYDESGAVRKTEMPTAGIAGITDRRVTPTSIRLGREATGSAVMFPSDNMPPTSQTAPPTSSSASAAPPRRSAGLAAVARPAAPSTTQATQKEPTREEMEDAEFRRRQEFRKREGIGGAREEIRSFLSEENNKLAEQFGRDKMLAFAEAGFKMAAAASRPGATFLGALSEGAISGTQALRGLNKEMDANRRGLRESMLKLREAEELEKMGDYDKAVAVAQSARAEIFERQKLDRQLAVDVEKIKVQREGLGVQMRGQNLDYAARTARGQSSGIDAGAAFEVLKDRIKGERDTIQRLDAVIDTGGELNDTQQAAYNRAIKNLNALEAQRGSLAGLGGGGGGVVDWNALPK